MSSDGQADATHYSYKPSLMGAPLEVHLADDALEWRLGGRSGRVPYSEVRRVRLAFRPTTMQNHRFIAEVWPTRSGKIEIASSSWRSLLAQERHDAAYRAFIEEFHRRLAATRGSTVFQAGSPPLLYWPGLVIFAGLCLAIAALTVRALQADAWAGAAFIMGMLALFLWQTGSFFRRNRPEVYSPEALPPAVLP